MMTAKRRPDRRFLIPAVGIATGLLLVLLRPVSLARPEAQNPARDRWVGYYMVLRPTADYELGGNWETYGDTKILNAQRQSDGRYSFTDMEGQALFFEFLPPTDPEDPYSELLTTVFVFKPTGLRVTMTVDSEDEWMKEEALRLAREAEEDGRIAVINAALLESMGFVPSCDEVVLVIAPYEVREARALKRDGMTAEKFRARSDAQKDIGLSLFASGRKVTTIVNDSDLDTISRQVSFLCAKI